MNIRDQIVELALSYENVCPTHRKSDYVDLLTRGGQESAQTAEEMMHMSSCALAVRGFWYKIGVRHKWLNEHYRNGMAPRDVIEIARSFDAIISGKKIGKMPEDWDGDNPYVDSYCPQLGDSYYVLFPLNGEGEHFGTVTKVTNFNETDLEFESIDGGQANGGIMKVTNHFQNRGSYWVSVKNGKSLFYWFDADKLVITA